MYMKKLFLLFSVACLTASTAYASKHAAVGSRELSQKERSDLAEERSKQESDYLHSLHDHATDSKLFFLDEMAARENDDEKESHVHQKAECLFDGYPMPYQGAHHWVTTVSYTGDVIEFEDGSLWKIRTTEAALTLSWLQTDCIVVMPHKSWFSSFMYKVCNLTLGQEVHANILDGPYCDSPFLLWIIGVDYSLGRIYLCDGSIWDMSSWDNKVVKGWFVGDVVIAGGNNDWLSRYNPYILINVSVNNYARGDVTYF